MKFSSKCNVEKEILLFWWQKNPVFVKNLELKWSFILYKCLHKIYQWYLSMHILQKVCSHLSLTGCTIRSMQIGHWNVASSIRFRILATSMISGFVSILILKSLDSKNKESVIRSNFPWKYNASKFLVMLEEENIQMPIKYKLSSVEISAKIQVKIFSNFWRIEEDTSEFLNNTGTII